MLRDSRPQPRPQSRPQPRPQPRPALTAAAVACLVPLVASCTPGAAAAQAPMSVAEAPAAVAVAPAAAPAAPAVAPAPAPPTLTREQQLTTELHQRLTAAGVYSGPIGTVATEQTSAAVARYSRKVGLPVRKTPGPMFWARLRSATKKGDGVPARCRTEGKVICLDKSQQVLRTYQDGRLIEVLDVRFGRPSLPTANGTFKVKWRSRNHWSSTYDAAMPYALFFYGGQAVHYSPEFARHGYSRSGSHGCVNLRDKAGAARVFDWASVGTKVVVYWS